MEAVHWRRRLRDGGVEYYMRVGGSSMQGTITPGGRADDLRAMFECTYGPLPEPEYKRPRGSWADQEEAG